MAKKKVVNLDEELGLVETVEEEEKVSPEQEELDLAVDAHTELEKNLYLAEYIGSDLERGLGKKQRVSYLESKDSMHSFTVTLGSKRLRFFIEREKARIMDVLIGVAKNYGSEPVFEGPLYAADGSLFMYATFKVKNKDKGGGQIDELLDHPMKYDQKEMCLKNLMISKVETGVEGNRAVRLVLEDSEGGKMDAIVYNSRISERFGTPGFDRLPEELQEGSIVSVYGTFYNRISCSQRYATLKSPLMEITRFEGGSEKDFKNGTLGSLIDDLREYS